jgi:glutamate synthase domain-containing protein 3
MQVNKIMIVNDIKIRNYRKSKKDLLEINAAPNGVPLDYKLLNSMIHDAIDNNYRNIVLNNVCGQRFIGAALQGDLEITINGIPGNDLGIFMDGPRINVFGNCEDQSGNTMNQGIMIIDGDGGDVIGLSSRGGKIYVKGDVGYRVGIHMKEYENQFPVIIIGGTAKDFLGEYMAGGKIIVLGLKISPDGTIIENPQPICGTELGTGIHRGIIYLRTDENIEDRLGVGAKIIEPSSEEQNEITTDIADFCKIFNIPLGIINNKPFKVIKPVSKRPFGGNYCNQLI